LTGTKTATKKNKKPLVRDWNNTEWGKLHGRSARRSHCRSHHERRFSHDRLSSATNDERL